MAVSGIVGVVVAVVVGSPGVVVGAAAKDVVVVKAEAIPMETLPPIRCAPCAKAVLRSARRHGAAAVVTMDDRAAIVRRATALMASLPRSREARVDPVGIVCPEMTLVENAASVW